jgi:hypothetical protein
VRVTSDLALCLDDVEDSLLLLAANTHLQCSVARVLQGCYKGVTRVLQGCYRGVTRVLQRCYKGVTRALQGCYESITKVLRGCYRKSIFRVRQWQQSRKIMRHTHVRYVWDGLEPGSSNTCSWCRSARYQCCRRRWGQRQWPSLPLLRGASGASQGSVW